MRGIIAWNQKVILGILPRFLFPKEFLCGGAVDANQCECAWNVDGKKESI